MKGPITFAYRKVGWGSLEADIENESNPNKLRGQRIVMGYSCLMLSGLGIFAGQAFTRNVVDEIKAPMGTHASTFDTIAVDTILGVEAALDAGVTVLLGWGAVEAAVLSRQTHRKLVSVQTSASPEV